MNTERLANGADRLQSRLAGYAAYHRDARNVATHFLGIPMIVFAVMALMSRPYGLIEPFGWISPAALAALGACVYYAYLDRFLGVIMTALLWACGVGALWVAHLPTTSWLGVSIGLFAFGWVLQFIGHYFEGRKPAFVDDLGGLIVGPAFIVCEALFHLGWRPTLHQRVRDTGHVNHAAKTA